MKLKYYVDNPDLNRSRKGNDGQTSRTRSLTLTLVLQALFAKQEKCTFRPIREMAGQNKDIKGVLFESDVSGRRMIHHLYFRRWVVGFEARVRDHYVVAKRGTRPLIHTADGVLLSGSVQ